MSDPLDRAVDAQIDAFRPDTVPPFAAIETRKRARDRRRNSRAAVLSALSVVGVVGVVFAGPSLTGGGGDRVTGPQLAGPAATPTTTVDDKATTRYGLSYVDPGAYDADRDEPPVTACLALPGTSEVGVEKSSPPGYSVLLTGSERAAVFERCAAALDNVAVRDLDVTLPGSLWTGVTVCRTQPAGPCQELDADTANRLYDALDLDNRRPAELGSYRCLAGDAQSYSLLFSQPGADVQEILVPTGPCSPVRVGSTAYVVDDAPRELVRQAYDAASSDGVGLARPFPGLSVPPPSCPDSYSLPTRQGAEEQPRLTPAPDGATAVLVCASSGIPDQRLQVTPLATVTDRDDVDRLARALADAAPLGGTRGCGIMLSQVLVFLHPTGSKMYAVQSTEACHFISDGSTRKALPPEIAGLLAR